MRSFYRSSGRTVVLRSLLGALLLVLLSTGSTVAQTASSVLRGVVRNGEGKPAIAAVVQARSEKSGAVRTAITDDDGRYQMAALPLGVWSVVARAVDGSVTLKVTDLELAQRTRLETPQVQAALVQLGNAQLIARMGDSVLVPDPRKIDEFLDFLENQSREAGGV